MIYLQLLWVFVKIGVLGFGGGYAMLSLIQHEVVDHYAWMSTTDFADMVAISQMTPGPISINLATYVGYTTAGFGGSLLASFALCLPSIIMVYFILKLFMSKKNNALMANTLKGLKPAIAGLIFAAGLSMMNTQNFVDFGRGQYNISVIICVLAFVASYIQYQRHHLRFGICSLVFLQGESDTTHCALGCGGVLRLLTKVPEPVEGPV